MTTCLFFQNLAWLTPYPGSKKAWRLANSIDIPGKWEMNSATYNFKVDSYWGRNRKETL